MRCAGPAVDGRARGALLPQRRGPLPARALRHARPPEPPTPAARTRGQQVREGGGGRARRSERDVALQVFGPE
eukprot:913563-Rhodomonas_salina.1